MTPAEFRATLVRGLLMPLDPRTLLDPHHNGGPMNDLNTAAPTWLAEAEADRENFELDRLAEKMRRSERHAAFVNIKLRELGIEPVTWAKVDSSGGLDAALLVDEDYENGKYAVYATWGEHNDAVELWAQDYETPRRFSQMLNSIGSVAAAQIEAPKVPPLPRPDYRALALRAVNSLREDYVGCDAAAVAAAIHGLTYAVLHLAEQGAER